MLFLSSILLSTLYELLVSTRTCVVTTKKLLKHSLIWSSLLALPNILCSASCFFVLDFLIVLVSALTHLVISIGTIRTCSSYRVRFLSVILLSIVVNLYFLAC